MASGVRRRPTSLRLDVSKLRSDVYDPVVLREQQRGEGVPEVVQPEARKLGFFKSLMTEFWFIDQ